MCLVDGRNQRTCHRNKRRNQQRRKFNHTAVLSALLSERSPDLFIFQRERHHVECVQNSECKREVSTSHDHHCSQPTSERGQRPQSLQVARLVSTSVFVLQPSTSGRRPSASGLRPRLSASDLRPSSNLIRQLKSIRYGSTVSKHKIKQ